MTNFSSPAAVSVSLFFIFHKTISPIQSQLSRFYYYYENDKKDVESPRVIHRGN